MDNKDNKYNFENIPDKYWDAIPVDVKKDVDKDIEAKLKGNIKSPETPIQRNNRRSDIA